MFVLDLRLAYVCILVNHMPAEGTMPVTKIVVVIALLEPHDPVDVAAVLADVRIFLEYSPNHF